MREVLVDRYIINIYFSDSFDEGFFVGVSNLSNVLFYDRIREEDIKLSEHLPSDVVAYQIDVLLFGSDDVHSFHKWQLAFQIGNDFRIEYLLTDDEG